jgi:hypothetical protein
MGKEFGETDIGKALKKKLEIRTPTVAIAIRGTEFTVTEDSVMGAEIIVFEGFVEIKGNVSQESKLIEGGYKGSVTLDGVISGPYIIDTININRWWKF